MVDAILASRPTGWRLGPVVLATQARVALGDEKTFHIGVDVVINILPPPLKKLAALASVVACLVFALMMLKGAWDYWYPFATERAWMETNDIPMIGILRFIEPWLNEGEAYEKLPRFIPFV